MKEFNFNYFTAKNSVSIDDFVIKTKTGPFIKKEFPISNLQSFYIFDNDQYRSVFFIYTDEKGKAKKIQVFATPAEMGFNEMVNELNMRFAPKSLNHLSEAEAFKAMKVANPKKWAPFVAFGIIMLVLAGMFYPGLTHYFDFDFANVNVREVATGNIPNTRNINITGDLLDQALEVTTTTTKSGSTTKSVSVFIPMVETGWKEGDPIKVILSFDKLSDEAYSRVLESTDFTGVIRNVAWEGISTSNTDFFKNTYNMNIPEKPILVEITNEKHNDSWVILVFGLCFVIMAVVFLIVAIKRKKSK